MAKGDPRLTEASVLHHIGRLPHAKASFKQLVREFSIKGGARVELDRILTRLAERGEVIELKTDQYVVAGKSREYSVGKLNMHRDGFGFVVPEKAIEGMRGDIYVSPDNATEAMHGDRVVARITFIDRGGKAEGEIVRIL
ncbi:MAG TPA: ribonuclease R, partial [Bryobacteraceae bacterium]|nr:ribonuclease R [Bryobacteraceae bacterium]